MGSAMDSLSIQARSERMSLIRSADTAPELVVRRVVHALGFRYRLHVKTLPGKPDLVFPRLRKVIFVHGRFWHRHKGQNEARHVSGRRLIAPSSGGEIVKIRGFLAKR